MAAKKLNKKNEAKFQLIKTYLESDDIITLADNDETYLWFIINIWKNASGVHISGKEAGRIQRGLQTDTIYSITKLFNACRKGDDDFKTFLEGKI